MSGTYDPGLNLLYWGTSNPAPDFEGGVRPGDDLYTDCVLALEPDTGQLKWYFQFTPHDLFDYDATETPILIDAPYKGGPRKLLVEANRNGFIYVLDRVTGQFLSAISFVSKLNWAKGIDAKGRPILTHVEHTPEGTRICPGFDGATNWFSPSYNESTHLVYFLALEECETFFLKPEKFKEGQTFYSTGIKRIPTETSQKILLAYNLETQSFAWRYPQAGHAHSSGGTMTTAGGLLFFRSEEHTSELQSRENLVCRLLLEKKNERIGPDFTAVVNRVSQTLAGDAVEGRRTEARRHDVPMDALDCGSVPFYREGGVTGFDVL